MANDAENPVAANDAGRVNVQIPTGDHDDLKTVVFWLPAEFPTLREATAEAVRQFCRKHLPRAMRRAVQNSGRRRAAPRCVSRVKSNTETQEHASPET